MPKDNKAGNESREAEFDERLAFALSHKNEPEKIVEKVKADEGDAPVWVRRSLTVLAQCISSEADRIDPKPTRPPDTKVWLPPLGPHYQEGQELRKLAQDLEAAGQRQYDNRQLEGHEADDDPAARPATLFRWQRVKAFLPTLPDDQARRAYLLKLKAAFLNKDPRAVVGKNQRFAAGADFGKKIEDEITLYEKILGNVTGQPLPAAAETEAGEEITGTARRQTLAVLLMLFDGFAIPGYVTKARVHEFLAFLTGKSKDNFKKLCTNPTGYNEQSTSSRDALMEDLRAVRKIFEDLQDETRAGVIESQIQSMSGYDSIIPSD